GQVRDPDLAGLEQGVGELLAGQVRQSDHFGAFAGQVLGGYLADEVQRIRVEDLDAARLVVLHDDQPAILGDSASYGVARLDEAAFDALAQQVDLAQAAVATEYVAVAAVAGIGDVGVGQIAQSFDAGQSTVVAGFHYGNAACSAFDDEAQIVRASGQGSAGVQQNGKKEDERFHGLEVKALPSSRSWVSHRASAGARKVRHAGMAVPGRPSWIVRASSCA